MYSILIASIVWPIKTASNRTNVNNLLFIEPISKLNQGENCLHSLTLMYCHVHDKMTRGHLSQAL